MGQQHFVRGDRKARPAVEDIRARAPYDNSVEYYLDAGWFPLPAGGDDLKQPVETGYSGWKNDFKKKATKKNAREIHKRRKGQGLNVALWLPPGILAIDVDAYKAEGAKTLAEMQAEFGKLPDTITSSARGLEASGSGIRYYRVPLDLDLHGIGIIGKGIEAVHRGTRIAVVPPSYHVETEQHYKWYQPGQEIDGNGSFEIPEVGEAIDLPPAWVDMLRHRKHARYIPQKKIPGGEAGARKVVDAWIARHNGKPCAKMLRGAEPFMESITEKIQRHENAYLGSYHIMCLAAEGHTGLESVLDEMYDALIQARAGEELESTTRMEWLRFVDGGVKMVLTREDNNEFYATACTCPALGSDGRPRPDLNINEIDLPVAIPECYKAMAARKETGWLGAYHKGGMPVLMDHDGMHDLDVDTLRESIMRSVNCYRLAAGDEPRPIPTAPGSPFLASMVKSWIGLRELPELLSVVDAPFYAMVDDKPKLIHENGYHPDARTFLKMDPALEKAVAKMNEVPEKNDLRWARQWIEECIGEFPFVAPADKAAVYAALILPFARGLFEGAPPLHLFVAPVPGTGKGLLSDVVSLVACGGLSGQDGRELFTIGRGQDREAELQKKADSALRKMPKVIQLDNVSGTMDSDYLCMASTNEYMSVRLMHTLEMVDVPNHSLWIITGNNFQATGETQRRVVPCRLNARVADPAGTRSFKVKSLRRHVKERRAHLVWAVLTLIANWVSLGSPGGKTSRLNSYPEWEAVVGGILDVNGIEGFLDNLNDWRSVSRSEYDTLQDLMEEWVSIIGIGKKVQTRDLIARLPLAEEMVSKLKGTRIANLNNILGKHVEVPENGYVLKMVRPGNRHTYWMERVGQPAKFRRGRPPGSGKPLSHAKGCLCRRCKSKVSERSATQ